MLKNFFGKTLSGGNSFETEINLTTREAINLATMPIFSESKASIDEKIKEKTLSFFYQMEFQANYFCGRWILESGSANLNNLIKIAIRIAFYNGISGIYKDIDGIYRAVNIIELKQNSSKSSAKVQNFNGYFNIHTHEQNNTIFNVPLDKMEDLAIFRWNTTGIGAWIWLLPFAKQMESLDTMSVISAYSYLKKYQYNILNPEGVKEEIDNYFDETMPFLVNITNLDEKKLEVNTFSTKEIDSSGNKNELKDYYNFYLEKNYNLFGRRFNEDKKESGERNIAGEVEASQHNYDVLEKETFTYLMDFKKSLEEISGYEIGVI